MRIGIFPGSFNPVHIGHLAIANYLAEFDGFDEIWFLVTPHNPLKKKRDLLNDELRLEMVKKSIEGYDKFQLCMIEWELPQPTYTINSLQKLRMNYPEHTFELIIGSDNWLTFHRWKDFQMILKNFKVVIYPRRGSTDKLYVNHPNASLSKDAPKIDISSTDIRKSIRDGKDVRFYMPVGIYQNIIDSGELTKEPEEEEEAAE
jgi:nicotinate (nicotinamide) nucleotide adenylyltransferase